MNDIINKRKLLVRAIVAFLILAFVYYIRDSLTPVIISLFLFYILNPIVTFLSKKPPKGFGIPTTIAIIIAFSLAVGVVYLFFRFFIPPLAHEFKRFGQNIPAYINTANRLLSDARSFYLGFSLPESINNMIVQSIQGVVDSIIIFVEETTKGLLSITSKFIQLIMIPILTYYLLKDKETLKSGLIDLIPRNNQIRVKKILSKINNVLNSYVKGVLILCFVVGSASTLGLYFLGVKYFLLLGIIAGITEAIPFVGPWIGAIPAVATAILVSPILGMQVAILYFAIQTLENHFLVPKILGDKLNLHPISIIIAILILGKILGAWGLFFAAPILAILRIIYIEIQEG